jgi:hypothetical protein
VSRRLLAAQLVAVAALLTVPLAGAADVQKSAYYVRMAIPAMEAYAADHGSYKGATIAKLRRYDRSLGHIVIRTATRRTYCIQSTTRPVAHKAGPGAAVRTGACGTKGTEVGYPAPPPSNQPPLTAAQTHIRAAVPAIEGYGADHNGYAGMTIAALHTYDPGISDITIVRATRDTYCIESGTGAEAFFKDGPAAPITAGTCPAS